jgi:hypothetical protein
VDRGVEEVDPTADGWAQFKSTGVTSLHLELHGKGEAARAVPKTEPVAVER